ncbi:GNAT family N-acetyltransferase [Gimesia chilikensis]|uniref:BioF2-like acetyltransferase domain-containing protein n=1 Tax=Gimesia chilikensis TaxID=2605989 RepID=A0A517PJS3_9PLAN|nr:GNAT family N-acetyltransferase [Gimesia chilikensis]QDT19571.1 hypothetical protein HG66A1_13370 [Gimesia chilikensis]
MSDVIELNEIDALLDYHQDWTRLLSVTPGGSFYRSLEWLRDYWTHFAEDQKLRVLVIRDDGEVTGIVPLCIRRIKSKFGTCRIVTYPFDDWGSIYGPSTACPEQTLTTALKYLLESRRDWDMIDLRCVDSDSFDRGATERALATNGLVFEKFLWNQTMFIDLNQSWDDYLKSRPKKARQTYLRAERKVPEDGEIEFFRYRPGGEARGEADPRWDLYEQCEQIALKSWQGSSTSGTTITHEKVSQFFRDSYASAIRAGAADLNLIYLSGKPAAFCYNYHLNGYLDGIRMGYDSELSSNGLGRLLIGRLLHDSMDRGDQVMDMGYGAVGAKKYWYTSMDNVYRYVYYSPTSPIANVLKLSHQVAGWFRDRFSSGEAPDPEFQDNPSLPTPGKREALAGTTSDRVKSGSKG